MTPSPSPSHCKLVTLTAPSNYGVCNHQADAGGASASSAPVPAAGSKGRPLLSFAKATFAAEGSDQALDMNDPSFWEKVCALCVTPWNRCGAVRLACACACGSPLDSVDRAN